MKAAIVVFMLFCCSVITSYCLAQGSGTRPFLVISDHTFKIAILPWKILTTWAPQEMDQVVFAGAEQAISDQSNRVRLEYSFHRVFPAASQSKVIDKSIVSKQVKKKIWKGSKPNLDLVIDVAEKLGVNGVLLCHFYVRDVLDDIGCYAIEVSSKRSFKATITTTGFTY